MLLAFRCAQLQPSYSTPLYCSALYPTILYSTALYSALLHSTSLHSTLEALHERRALRMPYQLHTSVLDMLHVQVCVYMYIHVCMRVCIHISLYMYIYIYVCTYRSLSVCVFSICTYTKMCTRVLMRTLYVRATIVSEQAGRVKYNQKMTNTINLAQRLRPAVQHTHGPLGSIHIPWSLWILHDSMIQGSTAAAFKFLGLRCHSPNAIEAYPGSPAPLNSRIYLKRYEDRQYDLRCIP